MMNAHIHAPPARSCLFIMVPAKHMPFRAEDSTTSWAVSSGGI